MSPKVTLEQLEEIVRLRERSNAQPGKVIPYGAYCEAVMKVEAALVEEAIAARRHVPGDVEYQRLSASQPVKEAAAMHVHGSIECRDVTMGEAKVCFTCTVVAEAIAAERSAPK